LKRRQAMPMGVSTRVLMVATVVMIDVLKV
jgi:hypothetical protein